MATKEQIELVINAATAQAITGLNKLNQTIDISDKKTKKLSKTFENVKGKWLGLVAAIGGTTLAVKKAFDISVEAGKYNQSVKAMENQFRVSSDKILKKLQEVSGGTIANNNLIEAANRAMALNVTKDTNQMAKLLEIARMRARAMGTETTDAFNDIVTGIGRASPLILDNLGIITKGWADEAKATGKTYDAQFILNKVLQQGSAELKKLGKLTLTDAEKLQVMQANAQNASVALGQALLPATIAVTTALSKAFAWFNKLPEGIKKAAIAFAGMGVAITVLTKIVKLFGVATKTAFGWVSIAIIVISTIITVAENWEIILKKIEIAWNKIRYAFKIAWQFIKMGWYNLIATFSNAVQVIAGPFLTAIDLIILGINKVTDSNIKSLKVVLEETKKNANDQIITEYNKLVRINEERIKAREKEKEEDAKHKTDLLTAEEKHQKDLTDKRWKATLKQITMMQKVLSQTQAMFSRITAIANQYYKNIDIKLDNQYNKEKKTIENTIKDETEQEAALEALDEKYEKKRRKLARKQAKIEKASAIVEATINGAVATTRAYSDGGPYAGPYLAAAVGALTAAQIALIAAQPLPEAQMGALIQGSQQGQIVRVGENNRSELIVPFENEEVMSKISGDTYTINFNIDTMLADEEFPRIIIDKIDKGLYDLKRENQSRLF